MLIKHVQPGDMETLMEVDSITFSSHFKPIPAGPNNDDHTGHAIVRLPVDGFFGQGDIMRDLTHGRVDVFTSAGALAASYDLGGWFKPSFEAKRAMERSETPAPDA